MRTTISFTYAKCWACILSKNFGTRIRFLSQRATDGVIHEVVELWNKDKGLIDKALRYLIDYPHISTCKVLSRSHDGCIARVGITTEQGACPLYPAIEAFAANGESPAVERVDFCGKIHWDLNVKTRKKLKRLEDLLERRFMIEHILVKREKGQVSMSKSMFLLKEAFERGYFDVPKRISIEDLSRELKIPQSTLSIDMRRALKNVLRDGTH